MNPDDGGSGGGSEMWNQRTGSGPRSPERFLYPKNLEGAGAMAQQLRTLTALPETGIQLPAALSGGLNLPLTLAPGDLTFSSRLLGHCTHVHIQK